ncbi:hypothetical protein [Microbispora rosea]|uniref:hypothetical protein n=1 Tax=Microbispora rosea TaxID=58117 RepID=UPI00379F36F3
MKLLKPLSPFRPGEGTGQVPSLRVTALALVGSWLCVAVAESVFGDLDETTSIAAIAEGGGRLTAGGLIALGAAALLGLALAGLGPIMRGSVAGRIGWALLVPAVPCSGAFAMFHLILVETGASGLNQTAMEQFVVERSQGPGLWAVPVTYYVFLGFLSMLLVLIALVRRGVTSVLAPVLFAAGFVGDNVVTGGVGEIACVCLMTVGAAVASYGLWRVSRQAPARTLAPESAGSGMTAA